MTAFIDRVDHLVLTVTDIEKTTQFYEKTLGFEREFFKGPEGQPRYALLFGQYKINLQDKQTETPTKAIRMEIWSKWRNTSSKNPIFSPQKPPLGGFFYFINSLIYIGILLTPH